MIVPERRDAVQTNAVSKRSRRVRHGLRYAAAAWLAAAVLGAGAATSATPAIYWTDSALGSVTRSNLDGTGEEPVVPGGLGFPEGIVLLPETSEMGVAEGSGVIVRADLDGGGADTVLAGLNTPAGLAVDTLHGKIYWTNVAVGTIHRANLDGSEAEQLLAAQGHVRGLALDVEGGKMYFTAAENAKLERANLDGSDVEELLVAPPSQAGIALDLGAGKMYWAGAGIRRADLDGSNEEIILSVPASGVALDLVAGRIYWTAFASPFLGRADLDGSNVEDLVVVGPSVPRALALLLPSATSVVSGAHAALGTLRLEPARPNPTGGGTALSYRAADGVRVSLTIHDVTGRVVRRLVEGAGVSEGDRVAFWDGRDSGGALVRAGVYFVELRSGTKGVSRKIVVAR
jgi:low density lipoprotein receptor-related protein 5/6